MATTDQEVKRRFTYIMIQPNGTIEEYTAKEQDLMDDQFIMKKCCMKDGLVKHVWKIQSKGSSSGIKINLYAKKTGRAKTENKYELPPPVDSELYFGSLLMVAYLNDQMIHLTQELWESCYNILYGGFEDIGSDDSSSDEDEDEDEDEEDEEYTGEDSDEEQDEDEDEEQEGGNKKKKTSHGYLLDGFVVSDSADLFTLAESSMTKKRKSKDISKAEETIESSSSSSSFSGKKEGVNGIMSEAAARRKEEKRVKKERTQQAKREKKERKQKEKENRKLEKKLKKEELKKQKLELKAELKKEKKKNKQLLQQQKQLEMSSSSKTSNEQMSEYKKKKMERKMASEQSNQQNMVFINYYVASKELEEEEYLSE